jgi:hypothetical protein
MLYPHQYFPTRSSSTDYITNPNYQMMTSYNQPINQQQQQQQQQPYRTSPPKTLTPPQRRHYQPPTTSYRYQPPHWHRTEPTPINYNTEPANDYIQRGIYRPTRLNPVEQREEPRILHYYTGFDHFSSVDPSDIILTRHHSPIPEHASLIRHNVFPQSDYVKSTM